MRKSLYLLVALACGVFATIMANQYISANNNTVNSTEILVAAVAIDIGQEITPERIRLEQWPADKVPPGSTGDLAGLKGMYAKQRFYVGEAIMPVKLMDENWTTVPKGFRVVAMKASDVSIANLIQPGDRVDVVAYFNKSDMIPQNMTKTVLMGIRVYALDGDTQRRAGEDRPKTLRNIQLLIHEKDTEAWTYANELGKVRLSLGSDADYSTEDGSNQAAGEFLTWLEDHRIAQEEAAAEKARLKNTPIRGNAAPTRKVEKEEEGFSMFKIVEGRMVEYRIVPGKLPVRVGEVGGEDDVASPSRGNGETETTDAEEDYSYLNGEDSPLYQPPGPRGQSSSSDY